jgi:anti-anti-sigma factor
MQLNLISEEPAVVCMECEGEITQNDFEPGDDPMAALLGPGGFSRRVLLNLQKTHYIDSSGISWLIVCHRNFLQSGGKLVLHTVPPMVNRVIQMLRLPAIMHLAPDEATARRLALGETK